MKSKCPFCKREVEYSLIPASPHPDSDSCCYDCLSEDSQKAYDKFFGRDDATLICDSSMKDLCAGPVTQTPSPVAGSGDAVPGGERSLSSYPGGKSGSGIYQRLINLIPRHRILISAFAGHCGIVRNIKPAAHTIVIDPDENVCQWWDDWRRGPKGRTIEIHHCDSIEWLRHRFGLTEYFAAQSCDCSRAESFVFCDPPYVLSERASGKQYAHELCDNGHRRLLWILTRIDATSAASVLLCGYKSPIYKKLRDWRSIDHRVPTRGGLQDERIWMNYQEPEMLHDNAFLGNNRRERERIRRRQVNWLSQFKAMGDHERTAMLEVLNERNLKCD